MGDIVKFTESTVGELDTKLKDVRIPRANLGPCPVCGRDINENRKGYSCWSREDPGCGFVIWKSKAGKQLPVAVARELIKTGRTEKAGDRLQGPLGQELPRAAGAAADRGRQVARRVRRALGAGGGQAARGRGPATPATARRAEAAAAAAAAPPPDVGPPRRRRMPSWPRATIGPMPLTLVLGPANSAKAGEVLGAYAARRAARRAAGRADRRSMPATTRRELAGRRRRARVGADVRRAGRARSRGAPATAAAGCPSCSASGCSARAGPAPADALRRVGRARRVPVAAGDADRRAAARAGHAAAVRAGAARVGGAGRPPAPPTPVTWAAIYADYARELERAGPRRPRAVRLAGARRAAAPPRTVGLATRCSSTASTS